MASAPADRPTLEQREAELDELEVALAFEDAQLRGRQHTLTSLREAMTARAAWLDDRETKLMEEADSDAAGTALAGLGGGQALRDVDVEGFVAKSATLHLGRVALLAAREEMLVRRQQLLQQRQSELAEYEAAFSRAEIRLAARERLVGEATRRVLQQLAERTDPGAGGPPAKKAPKPVSGAVRAPAKTPTVGLRLHGHPLTRHQVELDRVGGTILVSFDGFAPSLPEVAKLTFLPDESRQLRVRVRRLVVTSPSGSVAVLAPEDWQDRDFGDFESLLARLD